MKKRFLAMLLCLVMAVSILSVGASAVEPEEITVTKTDIRADGVFNSGGYASLRLNSSFDPETSTISYPKTALVDRNGAFVFPYKDTYNRYRYSDGIVSLTGDSNYSRNRFYDRAANASVPDTVGFWKLDGTPVYSGNIYGASPMLDGYAFITEVDVEYNASGDATSLPETCTGSIIDKNGNKVYSFTTKIGWEDTYGATSFTAIDSASWYRDGLLLTWKIKSLDRIVFSDNTESISYKDLAGNTVINLPLDKYSNAWPFLNGYAKVYSAENGLYGYIDKTGKEVIPCMYRNTGEFTDGLAWVMNDGKYGYINDKNELVIPMEYDSAYGAGGGLASVGKEGKYGLVDYNNNVVVPLEYDDISSFDEGVAYAIKDGILYIITANTAPSYQKGDVNRDGSVSNSDLILVARHVVNLVTLTGEQFTLGDMNGDDQITNTDIITVARMIVGLA